MTTTRYVGRLADWNDAKGFGFVEPNGGGERAFVHIKAFVGAKRRPTGGELISYHVESDVRGRPNAVNVRYAATSRVAREQRNSAGTWRLTALGVLAFVGLAAAWTAGTLTDAVLGVYVAMSLLAFVLYWHDKRAAMAGEWRTQESALHAAALLGGWPGALLAQGLLRHKSSKTSFQVAFWISVIVNCVAASWALTSGALL